MKSLRITRRLVERVQSQRVPHQPPTKTSSGSIPPCWKLGSRADLTLSSPVFICVVYCLNCCSCRPGHASVHQNRTVTHVRAPAQPATFSPSWNWKRMMNGRGVSARVWDESTAEDTVSIPPHTHTKPNKTQGSVARPSGAICPTKLGLITDRLQRQRA